MNNFIRWQAYEYHHYERPRDWFWALGILAVAFAIAALIFGNILFAILILVASFSVALHAKKNPEVFEFELNPKGVRINNKLYPYNSLQSFWVEDEIGREILIKSKKAFMPFIVLPLADQDPDEIRDYLINFIDEEVMSEPLAHKFLEYLGF
jgi:hypothetical protein